MKGAKAATVDPKEWYGQELYPVQARGITFGLPRKADGQFLLHRCANCGGCCRPPLLKRLLLTYADMVRLNKHFGYESLEEFRAKECVPATIRFLVGERPPANVLLYSRIATASGWCLKRTNDESSEDAGNGKPLRCRFLTADNRCSIYSVRPSPCRIFPYDIAYKTDSKMPHGMDIHATYAPQNDVDCKGFVAKRTISMWLLKQPAREITQHFLEMEETVKKGLYELKTEVVGSVPFAPIPYFQVGERGPR